MEVNRNIDVLMVKAREHKTIYSQNIEDVKIGYLDSILKKNNITTQIIDFAFSVNPCEDDGKELFDILKDITPKVIVFIIDKSPTNSPTYTLELLDGIPVDFEHGHITLYGNTQVGCLSYFKHRVNSVILGEEYSALSLIQSVLSEHSPEKVDGIAYLDTDNAVVINKAVQTSALDDLPFPTRYALPFIHKSQYAASILSSRGCFGKCSYCYLRAKEKYFSEYI